MRGAMGRGRRGPGLLGTAARTAVVAGTATAVSGRVAARQAQGAAAPAPPPAPAAPASSGVAPLGVDELHAQLMKLAELREAGLLTDAELQAQKARLLGS
jgi:hypothetical protein